MSKRSSSSVTTVGIIFVGILAWHYMYLIPYLIAALVAIALGMIIRRIVCRFKVKKRYVYTISDVNTMNGLAFERHVADVLKGNGYKKVHLTEYYDYGVDIIAEKDGVRWGVQVKCYSGLVGVDAVRQVVTGLTHYRCEKAMVITNSSYTTVAERLARSNKCVLIDGRVLKKLERKNVRRGHFKCFSKPLVDFD